MSLRIIKRQDAVLSKPPEVVMVIHRTTLKFEGSIFDVLGLLTAEKKTGKLTVSFNQGTAYGQMEFEEQRKLLTET